MRIHYQYVQVSKAAKMLDCSSEFIHQLIRDKKLEAINLGQRMTRVSRNSLAKLINEAKIDPINYYE